MESKTYWDQEESIGINLRLKIHVINFYLDHAFTVNENKEKEAENGSF